MQKLLNIFFFYLPWQIALGFIPGLDIASIRILSLILVLLWLTASLLQKKLEFTFTFESILLVTFLFLSALSLIMAENIYWSLRKLFFLINFIPLFFVFSHYLKKRNEQKKGLIRYLVISSTLVSALGIFQFILQFFISLSALYEFWIYQILPWFLGYGLGEAVAMNPSFLVNISSRTILRAFAIFPDPHMFSLFLGLVIPWSVWLSRYNKKWLFSTLILLIANLLTFSRGGYLGILAGIILTAVIFRKEISRRLFIFVAASISAIFILFILPGNYISQRFISSFVPSEGSNQGRIETWKQSLNVIADYPILGVGIGNYPLAIKPSADYREPIYSHNLYLDIAAETGMLNALLFISLLISAMLSYYRKIKINPYMAAGLISLITFSMHSLFETGLYSVHVLPILMLIISLSHD